MACCLSSIVSTRPVVALLVLLWATRSLGVSPQNGDDDQLFELHIRPVLAGTCFKCHGGESTGGGLRVDSRESLVQGGERGPAIVPGRPQESLLVRALSHSDDAVQMPPDEPLPQETLVAFTSWIEAGAEWPISSDAQPFAAERHWAFRPLTKPEPPPIAGQPLLKPIDRFLQAKLDAEGLQPVEIAGRAALLRRAWFDLLGLPPPPEQLQQFLADESPEALSRVVESLLASPHYGERWGRHWLDVVRYADTAGDNADYPVPEARLYRDYVIKAFNTDKPYDVFVREQLAGDLIADVEPADEQHSNERTIATGYLALSRRFATAPYELWHLTLEDAIDTTGRAFLGLTLRCARCHDHKFDPVTQEDYYALYGIFASTQFPWAGGEEFQSKQTPRQHFVPLVPSAAAADARAAMLAKIERLEVSLKAAETARDAMKANRLRAELGECRAARKLDAPQGVPVAYAVREGVAGDVPVQLRGEPQNSGPVIPRGVPRFLAGQHPPTIPPGASGRLQLAEWLTDPQNPLPARVMANRIWQWHFGRGLVATPSNFGLRGAPPDHPELLDYLASRLIATGWSLKSLHREIMASRAYALASTSNQQNATHDPDNRFYWRFDRRRLDAEAIRDAMLAVSGLLDTDPGEGHPFPPVGEWKWTQHAPFKAHYPTRHRSVYLMTQRIQRHPFLALFDGPDTNMSTDVRTSATVPSQALFLMNNSFVSEQAAALAERLERVASTDQQRVMLAGRLCWSRDMAEDEIARAVRFLNAARQVIGQGSQSAPEHPVWTSFARIMLASNEFVYID